MILFFMLLILLKTVKTRWAVQPGLEYELIEIIDIVFLNIVKIYFLILNLEYDIIQHTYILE